MHEIDGVSVSDAALRLLSDLIHQRTGLLFDDRRFDLLINKLLPLLKNGNYRSILDFYYSLSDTESNEAAWQQVYNHLAVNETYFWREYEQIRAAAEVIIPRLQRENPSRPVRIWHAACATGEEPYTMAMSLEAGSRNPTSKVEILATDFSINAINRAIEGVYQQRSFRGTPEWVTQRFFEQPNGGKKGLQIVQPIRDKVRFSYLNLMDHTAIEQMRNFDIIFCRNVFIYFSDAAIRQVTDWFYDALTPSGVLFVAAAESLLRHTPRFELSEISGAYIYLKKPDGRNDQNRSTKA
jgi:chemotaxis protein methyltransferase CheR